MSNIGAFAEQMFLLVLQNYPQTWSRNVQAILSLKKSYPNEIINLACKRALAFNVTDLRIIKNICHNGSYKLPVEFHFEGQNYEYAQN